METIIKKYSTIDMPMRVFLNAKCDGDMSEVENFDDVWLEYLEAIGGKKLKQQIEDVSETTLLKTKILSAQLAINLLPEIKDEAKKKEVFDCLKSLNYHRSVPAPAFDDTDKYCEQINGFVNYDVIKLQMLELKSKNDKENQPDVNYTRDFFATNMLDINVNLNIKITEDDSVRMYCKAFNRCIEHIERINTHNQKQQSRP